MSSKEKQDARRWAIEQAIRLHGASGVTTDKAISDARTILRFVDEEAAKDDPPAV